MEAYAVVQAGGKQYRVQAGDTLRVEKLTAAVGETVDLMPVLACSDGTTLKLGKPEIPDAKVVVKVVSQVRGPKVVAFKKKRRKGYRRKVGHRQDLTVVKVESLG